MLSSITPSNHWLLIKGDEISVHREEAAWAHGDCKWRKGRTEQIGEISKDIPQREDNGQKALWDFEETKRRQLLPWPMLVTVFVMTNSWFYIRENWKNCCCATAQRRDFFYRGQRWVGEEEEKGRKHGKKIKIKFMKFNTKKILIVHFKSQIVDCS